MKKIIITSILISTMLLIGIKVNAAETSGYGSAEYIDCSYGINNRGQLDISNDRCSNWIRFGNEDTFNERRLMYSNNVFITSGSYTWEKNNLYEIAVTIAVNPKDYDNFIRHLNRPRFEGGTTSSTSSLSSANITDYTMSYENYADNRYWIKLKFHFVPNVNLKSVWFQINYQIPNNGDLVDDYIDLALYDFQYYRVDYVRYEKSSDNTAIINSILNQTNQINNTINNATDSINNNINNINDKLNKEHEYNNNPSVNTNEQKQKMDEFEEEKDNLRNKLDLNIEETEITINANASEFIWEIVNKLRAISGKIVLLFTSILSLGIMKMILGR